MPARLIVEADGGSRGNPGPAAFGTVVRDADTGDVLIESAEFIGEATNNVAEYRGLVAGLILAKRLDPAAMVDVRLDSKLIVEQMSGRWKIKHPDMRTLALQARDVLPAGQVTYTWVGRSNNFRADALVNEVLDQALGGGATSLHREGAAVVRAATTRAEDVVGSALEAQTQALVQEAVAARPGRVMIGWEDIGAPTTTHLARHGATQYSLERRFSGGGGIDPPLAPLGIAQAEALAAEVARRGTAQRIAASPMLRAQQTAQIVSEATGLRVETVDGFRECDFGEWDGLTLSEVRAQWPEHLAEWLASMSIPPPGGESFEHLRARVVIARQQIVESYPGEDVLVVAHVSPIKVLVGLAIGAPLSSMYRMELPPCSLTSLAWFPDGNSSMFSFAEAGHLLDVQAPMGT
ncbi:MAG: bifunctional RNase H/acid phosphatase [Actinobacteria bacterium]|nr:bifunctional RNase H/acid phosphatase [Actinomycetota bacterium]